MGPGVRLWAAGPEGKGSPHFGELEQACLTYSPCPEGSRTPPQPETCGVGCLARLQDASLDGEGGGSWERPLGLEGQKGAGKYLAPGGRRGGAPWVVLVLVSAGNPSHMNGSELAVG